MSAMMICEARLCYLIVCTVQIGGCKYFAYVVNKARGCNGCREDEHATIDQYVDMDQQYCATDKRRRRP